MNSRIPAGRERRIERGMGARRLALLGLLLAGLVPASAVVSQTTHPGKPVYDSNCAHCHGEEADGQGYAFEVTFPRPRDLTSGMFKFRTTASGEYPTPDNLIEIISEGMPGTSMPPWKGVLSTEEIRNVSAYVQQFFMEEDDEPPEGVAIGEPPPPSADGERGRKLFETLECNKCHGEEGRGDGRSSMTLKDDWNDEPIYPRNLTAGWLFRGGHRPRDIYRTVALGLNGTPMPSHIDEEALAKMEDRWALVRYVLSLGPDREPEVKSTIVSGWTEEEIPLDGGHPLWEKTKAFYIPLSGQIVLEPRNFLPTVRYLWVRSLYNDEEIGFRVRWVDPTSRDNPALEEALEKATADEEEEEVEEEEPGNTSGRREGPSAEPEPPPAPVPVDELVIQFPAKHRPGKPLPYFLMGKPGRPVRLWVWRSEKEGMQPAKTSVFGKWRVDKRGDTALQSRSTYRHGLYTLTVKRKRVTGQKGDIRFDVGAGVIPISFSVVDGFKGEGGTKRAIASWYNLLLEQPIGVEIYYIPPLVALGVLGLLWLLMSRIRRTAERRK